MNADLARESRFFLLIAAIVGVYGATVTYIAAANRQLDLLGVVIADSMATIWLATFTIVFVAYALDLLLRRRPASPVAAIVADLRAHVLRSDALVARVTIIGGWFLMMVFFTPLKVMMGHVRGFPFDRALMEIDRALFFGNDPWVLTHALFGTPAATFVIQMAYNMWFVIMWLSIIYAMLRSERVRERSRYIVAFLLTWILVGSAGAWLLPSAGPCFYERAFGDAHFAPLMAKLVALDAEMARASLGVGALELQNMLWGSFAADRALFGGGISAMPSVHVATAVLIALGGYQLNRRLGHALAAFAGIIWIGSVHLGWHYAADGVVGAAMAAGIWRLSGALVDKFVLVGASPMNPVTA